MTEPEKLRELASWYREFAERAGNPAIWECRLRTADDLDEEARRLEQPASSAAFEAGCERLSKTDLDLISKSPEY